MENSIVTQELEANSHFTRGIATNSYDSNSVLASERIMPTHTTHVAHAGRVPLCSKHRDQPSIYDTAASAPKDFLNIKNQEYDLNNCSQPEDDNLVIIEAFVDLRI